MKKIIVLMVMIVFGLMAAAVVTADNGMDVPAQSEEIAAEEEPSDGYYFGK